MDLQKIYCGTKGAVRANASACSHFNEGVGWLWKTDVFVPKRNLVTVPNPRYLGMVLLCSCIASVGEIWAMCHSQTCIMVRQTRILPPLLELD